MSVDNIYVNASIPNNTDTTFPAAKFEKTYEENLLSDPSKFYASIVKFEIPLQSLPLYVWDINEILTVGVCGVHDPNPASPDFPGFDVALVYEPNTFNTTPNNYDYYFIRYYQHFVDMINTALQQAWVLAGSPGGPGNFPYFIREGELFSIIMPQAFQQDVSLSPFGNTVYWNTELQLLLNSFNIWFGRSQTIADPDSARFELKVDSFGYDASILAPSPQYPPNTYKIDQEYPSNEYFNSVHKIVITSTTLPVRKELFPPPSGGNLLNTEAYNTVPIVSDFQLDVQNLAGSQRGIALFDADIYRLIDLNSNHPLKKLDIEVWWVDNNNNFFHLPIPPRNTVTIKLAFFRRSLFKHCKTEEEVSKKIGGFCQTATIFPPGGRY